MSTPTSEVVAFTHPELFGFAHRPLRYLRVVAVSVLDERLGTQDLRGATERLLPFSKAIGSRLLRAMEIAESERADPTPPDQLLRINCHLFARLMTGMELSLEPPFMAVNGAASVGNLPAGEAGVVVTPADNFVRHSIVGLGEEVPESIQAMWGSGIIGICRNQDLLTYIGYYNPAPEKTAAMFRQT